MCVVGGGKAQVEERGKDGPRGVQDVVDTYKRQGELGEGRRGEERGGMERSG